MKSNVKNLLFVWSEHGNMGLFKENIFRIMAYNLFT